MRLRAGQSGYAMLAALVVMTLASTFALAAVSALAGRSAVEKSDAHAWRADTAAAEALSAAAGRLRWRPAGLSGSLASDETSSEDGVVRIPWRAEWQSQPALEPGGWQRVAVVAHTGADDVGRRVQTTIELQAEPWAAGVVCAGDAVIDAPLVVEGSGVYVGGSVYGRENVGFVQGAGPATPAGAPADYVHGDAFPAAAVHAGASIHSHGEEIHRTAAACLWPSDTDEHTSGSEIAALVRLPRADFVAAAAEHAVPLGDAWQGDCLHLEELALPFQDAESAKGGACVLTPRRDVTEIVGGPPTGLDPRLLILVPGDVVVGSVGETTSINGSLVVCGSLHIVGDLRITGALCAGRLRIDAPVRVTVSTGWRDCVVCGACRPVITEVAR